MHAFAFFLQSQPATGAPSSPLVSFLPLIFIVAIFYFLVFMPMQRQKKQQGQMLKGLQSGNEVLTTGGIVGTIVNISGDTSDPAREAGQYKITGGATAPWRAW